MRKAYNPFKTRTLQTRDSGAFLTVYPLISYEISDFFASGNRLHVLTLSINNSYFGSFSIRVQIKYLLKIIKYFRVAQCQHSMTTCIFQQNQTIVLAACVALVRRITHKEENRIH